MKTATLIVFLLCGFGLYAEPAPDPKKSGNEKAKAATPEENSKPAVSRLVGLPSEWNLRRNDCLSFQLIPAVPGALTLRSNLQEVSTKELLLSGALKLEKQADLIAICATNFQGVGRFTGSLNVAWPEKLEGETVSLTVYRQAEWSGGVVLVLLGTICFWIVRVLAPARGQRAQELEPASIVRDRVRAEIAALDRLSSELSAQVISVRGELNEIVASVGETALDARGFLTPRLPAPWSGTPRTVEYRQFLENVSARLSLLIIVARQGILPAADLLGSGATDPQKELVNIALGDLDRMSTRQPPPTPESLRSEVATRVRVLEAALRALRGVIAPAAFAADQVDRSTREIRFEIQQAAVLHWITWILLTVTIGSFVLVINKLDFGLAGDYLACFLWGFGVPAAGQALGPNTASTALGVTFPKTS